MYLTEGLCIDPSTICPSCRTFQPLGLLKLTLLEADTSSCRYRPPSTTISMGSSSRQRWMHSLHSPEMDFASSSISSASWQAERSMHDGLINSPKGKKNSALNSTGRLKRQDNLQCIACGRYGCSFTCGGLCAGGRTILLNTVDYHCVAPGNTPPASRNHDARV